jgi:hypothetical protein
VERQEAIVTVLADGGMGGGGANLDDSKKAWASFPYFSPYSPQFTVNFCIKFGIWRCATLIVLFKFVYILCFWSHGAWSVQRREY